MATSIAQLAASSRSEAMDFSLVLISQGVESTILHPPDQGWVLELAAEDLPRAEAILLLYQAENRPRLWRQTIPGTDLVFDVRVLGWWLLVIFFHAIDATAHGRLREGGCMDYTRWLLGDWWRPWTAMMLHQDLGHLIGNVLAGFVTLGVAMATLGAGRALLGALVAGWFGNVLSATLHGPDFRSLGASGLVLGALGLLGGSVWHGTRGPWQKAGLAAAGLLFVFWGTNPQSDVLAHLGGFLAGLALGALLQPTPDWRRRIWMDWVGLGVFLLLLGAAWREAVQSLSQ